MGTILAWPPTSWATPMPASHSSVRLGPELGSEGRRVSCRAGGVGREAQREGRGASGVVRQGWVRQGTRGVRKREGTNTGSRQKI